MKDKAKEVCTLPNGFHLYRKLNEAGGYTYYSDEVPTGCEVWDTALIDVSTLLATLTEECRRGICEAHQAADIKERREKLKYWVEKCGFKPLKGTAISKYDLLSQMGIEERSKYVNREYRKILRMEKWIYGPLRKLGFYR